MNFDEDKLKSLWQESMPETNEDAALQKVLANSAKLTGIKDIASMFIGWTWVLFLGFGASMYSAKRKLELHQQKRAAQTTANTNLHINKNNNGELQ